jgi:hypothetical protein
MLSGRLLSTRLFWIPDEIDLPENEMSRIIQRRYRRMVFQALAKKSCKVESNNSTRDRSDSDDEDLSTALSILQYLQQWEGPDPCIGFFPAPLPNPSNLPSSLSTNLDGKITLDEMKDFLKTLLVLKLRGIDIRIDCTSSFAPDLRQAVDSIIVSLDNSILGKSGKDINWSTFDTLFDTLIVRSASLI